MLRVLLGIIKGGIVGTGVGVLAWKLGIAGGALAFAVYACVGAAVGLVCGKAPWRQETLWTSGLKAIFGALIGVGLFWVARKLLGGMQLPMATRFGAPARPLAEIPYLLAPAIGILYGIFVEVDDAPSKKDAASKPAAPGAK